ncbi:MAG: hypothetical protein GC134_00855 [Proteobacteria bacterium]|nr:hypothetical protein [Pseudomonadota bacterium]
MPMSIVTDEDRRKVKEYLKQALSVQRAIDESRAEMRDILDVLKNDHDIKPSIARKVLKAMEKGNFPEIRNQNEELEDLYAIAN